MEHRSEDRRLGDAAKRREVEPDAPAKPFGGKRAERARVATTARS
jgi:hypothetical protein